MNDANRTNDGGNQSVDSRLIAFHAVSSKEALDALEASRTGLDADEVARRLDAYGANRLPEPPKRGALARLLNQFHNILIYVFLISAAVTAGLQHWVDMGVILTVVLVNAIIGFIQEDRAEQVMDAIRGMLALHSAVLRDGRRQSVEAAMLAPGDIVLIEARGLKTQEAVLTGESVPVDKGVEPVDLKAPLGDRTSMLFSGTLVTAGTGQGLVVATAGAIEIGRISGMLSKVEVLTTPLVHQMNIFARWLTVFILLIASSLLIYGYFVGKLPFSDLFMAVVGLSVAAIPEGFPAFLTITLAVGSAGDGGAERDHSPVAGHRDTRIGFRHLLRQDRNADPQRNDGDDAGRLATCLFDPRKRLCPGMGGVLARRGRPSGRTLRS
ncbi:cation-transporting P-type ATPase [Breoghania sp.]|uniref:P-type ATPase n=1 Tax=Breoghania sp. TaxID=2065378 RepID=UPI00261A9278|nr:cation-transporting P-type ATPase [Breoghania sp.]MDJ0931258.1 cation-transporting P-type ATPase [Breoghania sp.]